MALVESKEVSLGTKMPEFQLRDPNGDLHDSSQLVMDKGLLVGFMCNHCPYAQAVWPRFIRLAEHARGLGIGACAINPNIHPEYPEDAPPQMKKKIRDWKVSFPYLIDETQTVARDFMAQCTPDIYLFDAGLKLVYHGRVDDNWKDENSVEKEDLKEALDALGSGQPVSEDQVPSMGCSIKWLEHA